MEKDYEALRELEEELILSLEAMRELEESGWEDPLARYDRLFQRFAEELKKMAEEEGPSGEPDDAIDAGGDAGSVTRHRR